MTFKMALCPPSLLLLLLCLSTFTNAFSERSFDAPGFYTSNKDYFEYVSSQINPITSSVELTTSTSALRAAALWYKTPVLTQGLYTKFSFKIDNRNGDDSAHGVAFLIQNDVTGSISLGGVSAGLGYASPSPSDFSGIKNSIAIEFDCIGNPEMNDPTQAHLSIHTRNSEYNSANEQLASLHSSRQVADFCSGQTTTVEITYEPGFLTVMMSPIISPVVDRFQISIEDRLLLLSGGRSYIGFTASTGRQGAPQEITSWSYNFLGVPNAANSICRAPSEGVAGVASTFWFQIKDQYNNFYPYGDVPITFQLNGPGPTTSTVLNFNNGTYQFLATATIMGDYTVDARISGTPFSCSSSFSVNVVPGSLSGSKTVPITALPSQVTAGKMNFLKIQAYDSYGNKISHGGEAISAVLSPHDDRDIVSIEDGGDGTYTIYFTTFKAVPFSLSIFGSNEHIRGSPFGMTTLPDIADPANTHVEGWISQYDAGKTGEFNVVVFDQYQNFLKKGGDQVQVTAQPSDYVTIVVSDLASGVYKVSLNLQRSGKYDVEIKLNGVPILNSPFSLSVDPVELDVSNSYATGENLQHGFAGVQSVITIIGRDRFNNTLGGILPATFLVLLSGKNINITSDTTNNPDGTVTATYLPVVSGNFVTTISSEGVFISNSPFPTLIEPARESPANSFIAENNTLLATGVKVVSEVWLQVQIVDEFQNFLEIGGQQLTANLTSLKRTPISLGLRDNQNGTFTITFVPEKSQHGPYSLEILLDGEHIKDSPLALEIIPIDNTNTIALAVCLPIVFLSVIAIGGMLLHRKWKKGKGYLPLSTEDASTQ